MNIGFDIKTFIKAQATSLAATAVDFGITIFLREILLASVMSANTTGNILGGILSFMLGRQWVFEGHSKTLQIHASRYLVVWVGSLLLNAGGVFLLTYGLSVNYILAKSIVAVLVGFTYNYFLQKRFVFQ